MKLLSRYIRNLLDTHTWHYDMLQALKLSQTMPIQKLIVRRASLAVAETVASKLTKRTWLWQKTSLAKRCIWGPQVRKIPSKPLVTKEGNFRVLHPAICKCMRLFVKSNHHGNASFCYEARQFMLANIAVLHVLQEWEVLTGLIRPQSLYSKDGPAQLVIQNQGSLVAASVS